MQEEVTSDITLNLLYVAYVRIMRLSTLKNATNWTFLFSFLKAPGADPDTSHLKQLFLQTARLSAVRAKAVYVVDGKVLCYNDMEILEINQKVLTLGNHN